MRILLVTDAWQGRGLGAVMLSRLVQDAEQRGVSTLVAEVLPGNRAMIAVFERCGYPVAARWDAHGVEGGALGVRPLAGVLLATAHPLAPRVSRVA